MTAEAACRPVTEHDKLTILKYLASGRDIEFTSMATQLHKDQIRQIAVDHGHPDLSKLRWAADLQQKSIDQANAPRHTPRPVGQRVATPNPVRMPSDRVKAVAKVASLPVPSSAVATKLAADTPTGDPVADPVTALVSDLISQGLSSDKARTRNLAQKIIDCAKDLKQRLSEDTADQARLEAEAKQRTATQAEIHKLEKQLAAAKAKLSRITGGRDGRSTNAAYQQHTLARFDVSTDQVREWGRLNGYQVGTAGVIPRQVLEAFAADRETA